MGGGAASAMKPASPQSGAQNIASVGSRNVRNTDGLSTSPQDNKLGKHQEQHQLQNAPSREGIRDKIRRKGLKKVMAAVGGTSEIRPFCVLDPPPSGVGLLNN
jgi:hypothetical protein